MLDLIGAMDRRKSDVPTEIFSQGLEKPLAREQEKPFKYSARGAKSQPRFGHSTDQEKITKQVLPQGKFVVI